MPVAGVRQAPRDQGVLLLVLRVAVLVALHTGTHPTEISSRTPDGNYSMLRKRVRDRERETRGRDRERQRRHLSKSTENISKFNLKNGIRKR